MRADQRRQMRPLLQLAKALYLSPQVVALSLALFL